MINKLLIYFHDIYFKDINVQNMVYIRFNSTIDAVSVEWQASSLTG